jgi:NAD+ synthase (glutamine-hydrolysing)
MRVMPGKPQANVDTMLRLIKEAKSEKADLIAFPELCVSGYLIGDLWNNDRFCYDMIEYNAVIRQASLDEKIAVVWGNVYIKKSDDAGDVGFDGRKKRFNAVYISDGDVFDSRFKRLLPSYRIFDDKRYFYPGEDNTPVRLPGGKQIGLEICEDLWCKDYAINPTKELLKNGADVIINISASPFSVDKSRARDNAIAYLKKQDEANFVPFLYVNCVGVQDNGKNIVTFDGDSRVYNNDGRKIDVGLSPYEEGVIYAGIDGRGVKADQVYSTGKTARHDFDRAPIVQKFDAIIAAYKYVFYELIGKSKFIFGLSGGVDSAVNCALAVIAVGKENVLGFNLPSAYNSDLTKDAARSLAQKLGIKYDVIPIENFVKAAEQTFAGIDFGDPAKALLIWENIQAKIRGTMLLSTLAAINSGVMVNNGNKVETATGYATLYGDVNGIFAPLGDLTKIEVFEMAKHINRNFGDVIPETLIPDDDMNFVVAPSAELKEKQFDPFWWGLDDKIIESFQNYRRLAPETLLEWYREDWKHCATMLGVKESLFSKYGVGVGEDNPETILNRNKRFVDHIEWLVKLMQKSVFKRIQSPPIVILSKSAYGFDYRESQLPVYFTKCFGELKVTLTGEASPS